MEKWLVQNNFFDSELLYGREKRGKMTKSTYVRCYLIQMKMACVGKMVGEVDATKTDLDNKAEGEER